MKDYIEYLDSSYPAPPLLETYINELLSLDLSTISSHEIYHKVIDMFKIIPANEATLKSGKSIWRARRNFNNEFDIPHTHISSLGIPPEEQTSYGRANVEHKPVFYGSSYSDLTLFENCQKLQLHERYVPQNFTLSEWRVKEGAELRLAPLWHSNSYLISRNDIALAIKNQEQMSIKSGQSEKMRICSGIIEKFFADQFAKAPINSFHDYKFSAFYAEFIREYLNERSPIKFDGILYPSVAYKYKADNVALFPNSLHKIQITRIFSSTAYNFDFDKGLCTKGMIREGKILPNGEITWESLFDSLSRS